MKARIAATVTACALAVCACADDGRPLAQEPAEEYPFAVARAADTPRAAATTDETLLRQQAASNNRFAVDMYRQLAAADGNLFFSPYSMAAALGMTAAGARNATAAQMRTALHVTLADAAFHQALNGLQQDLEDHVAATDGVEFNAVNSLWAQTGFDLQASYLDLLARAYGAGVNLLDFAAAPDPSRQTINDWVSAQTRQRIQDLLPPGAVSPATRLVLTNAVYFLAEWLYRFDAALTADAAFYRLDGSRVDAPLMQLGADGEKVEVEYARDARAQVRAANLYYRGGRLCMTVLLPDTDAFVAFEATLTADGLDALVGQLRKVRLPPVRLPRFAFTSASMPLRGPLQALGMRDAFDPAQADFSGIDGRRDLFVSQVLHKAFVAVDEQGTEAAAATAVVIELTSMPVDQPQFVADRPFIFLIRDTQTGLILFMGRVVDPLLE